MTKIIEYIPKNVCSRKITIEVDNNKIKNIEFLGGCPGNTIGVSKLCENRDIDEVIELLKGIKCGYKETSCPDQLAKALIELKEQNLVGNR